MIIGPPPALWPTGPVVGQPIRPQRLHAPFHQETNSGGEILLRADGRPASATRWPNVNMPRPSNRRGEQIRPAGCPCPGNSACRPRATLAEAAGSLGRRRPGKPRRDPCFPCTNREHGGTRAVSRRRGSPREARSEEPAGAPPIAVRRPLTPWPRPPGG